MTAIKIQTNLIGSMCIPPIVNLKQYDKSVDSNGKTIEIELLNGTDTYSIPSSSNVTIRATKPDGTGYEYPCTYSGNVVSVEVKEQMTVCSGRYLAEIRIVKGDNVLATTNFYMSIEPSALRSDTVISDTDLPLLEKASQSYDFISNADDRVKEAKASAETAIEKAEEASNHASNAKKSEINASSSANEAKESAASVADVVSDVSQLKEDLANINEVIVSVSLPEQIVSTSDFSEKSTAKMEGNTYTSNDMFGGIGGFKNGKHYKIIFVPASDGYFTIKTILNGGYRDNFITGTYIKANTAYVVDVPNTIDFSNVNKYVVFLCNNSYVANADVYIYDVSAISEEILNNIDFTVHENPIRYKSIEIPQKTFKNGIIQENILYGVDASFLGDSLTANGSGSQYIGFVATGLGLSVTHNCGIGGTRVSGGDNSSTSFWTDTRVNSLSLNSDALFIMGGTNDAPYITVQDDDFTIENHDTSNFVGAYNVLISKVLYKYLKLSEGYYSDVDYSGVIQVETAKPYFHIILITPPKRFDSISNLQKVENFANYVIKIGQLWGLPVCDTNHQMNMNIINRDNYFTHQTNKDYLHFDVNAHRELANIVIGKVKSLN